MQGTGAPQAAYSKRNAMQILHTVRPATPGMERRFGALRHLRVHREKLFGGCLVLRIL
jgi:hypothetical protein